MSNSATTTASVLLESSVLGLLKDQDNVKYVDGIIDTLTPESGNLRPESGIDLSVLILAKDEEHNIGDVIQSAKSQLELTQLNFEIVVIDGDSKDRTFEVAKNLGARVYRQSSPGYAAAFLEGIAHVAGRWIIALDADCSHPASLIPDLIRLAPTNRIVVGSRWMPGGSFAGSASREVLSRILSHVFRWLLALPIRDVSSGYRLYHREIFRPELYESKNFSILQEILIRAIAEGHSVCETQLQYSERKSGKSHVALATFALSYIKTLGRMWLIRNDATNADYEDRAFDSWNLVQRFWQRRRFKNIMQLLGPFRTAGRLLDIGCGSSRVIQHLPHAVAFDLSLPKLRALERTNQLRVRGTALSLPFADDTFDCVIHSQLISQLPMEPSVFTEIHRILRPGGVAIIGSVDYGRSWWRLVEPIYKALMPHAYGRRNVYRYTLTTLNKMLTVYGFVPKRVLATVGGEIIIESVSGK